MKEKTKNLLAGLAILGLGALAIIFASQKTQSVGGGGGAGYKPMEEKGTTWGEPGAPTNVYNISFPAMPDVAKWIQPTDTSKKIASYQEAESAGVTPIWLAGFRQSLVERGVAAPPRYDLGKQEAQRIAAGGSTTPYQPEFSTCFLTFL